MSWLKECLMQALTAKVPSLILALPAYCFNAEASAHICAIFRRLIEDPATLQSAMEAEITGALMKRTAQMGQALLQITLHLYCSLLHFANSFESLSHENIYADKTIGQPRTPLYNASNWQRIVSALIASAKHIWWESELIIILHRNQEPKMQICSANKALLMALTLWLIYIAVVSGKINTHACHIVCFAPLKRHDYGQVEHRSGEF